MLISEIQKQIIFIFAYRQTKTNFNHVKSLK